MACSVSFRLINDSGVLRVRRIAILVKILPDERRATSRCQEAAFSTANGRRRLNFLMQLPQSVLAILERGGQVVTANSRAARDLRRLYGEHRSLSTGQLAWASPAIFDLQAWLATQWQQLLLTGAESRLLLTTLQEESVWSGIVRPAMESRSLVSPNDVARLAQSAYATLAAYRGTAKLRQGEWDVRPHDDTSPVSELRESELFRRWALEFERECGRRTWLSAAMLPGVLADAYANQRIASPDGIVWSGFDRVTPAEAALRKSLPNSGCTQHQFAWALQSQPRRIAAQTIDQEMEACATWVGAYLQQHSEARVGVLVQNVTSIRAQMDRVFRRVLMPESAGLRQIAQRPVYEFTLGLPLGDVPMVRAALLLLRWLDKPLEQEQISWLLTTGFFGNSDDVGPLAAVDARLRQEDLLPPEEGLDALLSRLERVSTNMATTRWTGRMRQANASMGPLLNRERRCRQWLASIDEALAIAGWPGTRADDSVNYQVRERWERVMQELASLDFNDGRLTYKHFLEHLDGHARASIFSAESEDAPVSISGVLESAGRAFDAVWMLQTTDEAWPAKSPADPLLPGWLQRELGIPRGDATEDKSFSAVVTNRLQASSVELIFSYAREGPTGAQRASALIADLPEASVAASTTAGSPLLVELFEDDLAIPWPGGEHIAGGQSVLKKQAACPFQAFADRRLGGRETRSSEHGLDPLQRGKLVHTVLETLWMDARMRGSAGLKATISRGELDGCIAEHVQRGLTKYRPHAGSWESAYLALEEQRLCQLVQAWLLYEVRRADFVVEHVEAKQTIEIEGLRLDVRMDRIDRVENGRVLIDYKTGNVNAKQWTGDRPDEPQLPLYAVAGNVGELRDVYFAQLRQGKDRPDRKGTDQPRFVGALTGDSSPLLPGKQPENAADAFEAMRLEWRQTLGALSHEFQSGAASVDPKDYPTTCKFCAFSGLCRVKEARTTATGDEDEVEDE
jgi:ATP-dependent helicase/nuclease subunit B